MSDITIDFRREMIQLGIISFKEQETVWDVAKRCGKTVGLPMAGAGMVMGMKAGTVALPGGGTISGALAGFLGGLAAGTFSCTAANWSYRKELRQLLD